MTWHEVFDAHTLRMHCCHHLCNCTCQAYTESTSTESVVILLTQMQLPIVLTHTQTGLNVSQVNLAYPFLHNALNNCSLHTCTLYSLTEWWATRFYTLATAGLQASYRCSSVAPAPSVAPSALDTAHMGSQTGQCFAVI